MKRSVVIAPLSLVALVLSSPTLARRDEAVSPRPHTVKVAKISHAHASKYRVLPTWKAGK